MIHSYEIAPGLQSLAPGKRVCIVAVPVCLDSHSNRHLLASIPQYEQFVFQGDLAPGMASYSLLRVLTMKPEGNIRVLGCDGQSLIFSHPACTWQGSRQVIELCCGMGALGHGALASGFHTVVGCDIRPKMLELFMKHSSGKTVLGDICKFETLQKIYEAHPYSSVIASGIACQPYSQLGDQKGGSDPRASTLPATLSTAFYLRAMVVVIECVGPAKEDPFVQHHIRMFCQKTGFHKSECVQDLKDIWGSKRNRWWCVLSAPAIGEVELSECGDFPDLSMVGCIVPKLHPWPKSAEDELALNSIEIEAFQPGGQTGVNFLLNTRAPMACALHCWGSQLIACPCGCRDSGLSKFRLDTKGLFAVLVEGVTSKKTRHIHPQEAGALCGLDPCLTWGNQNRLALGAVGQLASPLQALWVFSHVLRRLQFVQFQVAEASPRKMMMAYRSWLLARCVRQWGSEDCKFPSTETLELSRRWMPLVHKSFQELRDTLGEQDRDNHVQFFWECVSNANAEVTEEGVEVPIVSGGCSATSECPTDDVASLGEGVVHGLTLSQVAIDTPSLAGSSPQNVEESSLEDIEPISVDGEHSAHSVTSVSSSLRHDVNLVIHGTSGEIDLSGNGEKPAHFHYAPGCTIEDVLIAESRLNQLDPCSWEVLACSPENENATTHEVKTEIVSVRKRLCPGLACVVKTGGTSSDSDFSHEDSTKRQKTISPEKPPQPEKPKQDMDHPLVKLNEKQFLQLTLPVVQDVVHASSLLSQRCPSDLRAQVLSKQGKVWSDDEIRWHLDRIRSSVPKQCVMPIDPLIVHGCFESRTYDSIRVWLRGQEELAGVYITVVLNERHWYPVCMDCRKGVLSVTTWDVPSAKHPGLEEFCRSFARALTVKLGPIVQHSRLFAGDVMCGAASIAYLEHRIVGTQLPEIQGDLECVHQFYRNTFLCAVASQERVVTPWLWGAGGEAGFDLAVQKLSALLAEHGVPSDFVHSRATKAVKAIGIADVLRALEGKSPWKSLKVLGTNVHFQFILPDELQAQISRRAGKEAVGKPAKKGGGSKPEPVEAVVLDPAKLTIPPGSFVGGGHDVQQIPLSMLGPLAEGVVIATWEHAQPYLRTSQQLAKGPLAMLVLHGPVGGCQTTLATTKVTVPARCSINNEPLLLEALLVQLGGIQVSRAVSPTPVLIDTVQVTTLKIVVYKDEVAQEWEEVTRAPMRYIIHHIPLLKVCKQQNCTCQHWHNSEKVEATEAIVDVWRRQFLRTGYKPEPVATSSIFSVCIRVPECLAERLLSCSGGEGIYIEPRSLDSKSVSSDYEVIWVPKAGKSELCHLRQVNPAVIGLARVNDRYGLRVRTAQAAALHKAIRPDAVYLANGTRQSYMVGPIPYGTDRKALSKALSSSSWEAKPLQPVSALTGERGVMWSVVAVSDPPTNIITMSHGDVVITKDKEAANDVSRTLKPVAAASTISLCGASGKSKDDPWLKVDPWGQYVPVSGGNPQQSGLATAAESIHQLESKIESAVLAKLPHVVAMDQDDVPDRVQELENRFNQMVQRQQQLESVVSDQGAQQSAQLSQMQSQLNAQGQQLAGHMDAQNQQIQSMFESQMAQIRGLLSKRPRDGDHE